MSDPAPHQRAYIGKGIVVKGDICGTEDLHVDGEVVGRIELADHEIVLGADACVTADLTARAITIGGTVVGSVIATERAAITETGCVEGDVRAPRVQIADGAVFGGRVDTSLPIEPVVPDASSAPVADLPPATRPCASEQHV